MSFEMRNSSDRRCGEILYREGERYITIYWELAAGGGIIPSLQLHCWTSQPGDELSIEKQYEIHRKLKEWLAEQQIRSHMEEPPGCDGQTKCIWRGCENMASEGRVICRYHYYAGSVAR
jgi:hypothetical protein